MAVDRAITGNPPGVFISMGYLYRADSVVEEYGRDFIRDMIGRGCLVSAFYRRQIRKLLPDVDLWETIDRDRRRWIDFADSGEEWEEGFIIADHELGASLAYEDRVLVAANRRVWFPNQWTPPRSDLKGHLTHLV